MVQSRSKLFHFSLGILVSFALLMWLILTVEWGIVGRQLAGINHFIFVPIISIFAGQLWLRGMRWRYLLPERTKATSDRIPLRQLFDGVVLGNFANYVLPLRAGEFLRPFIITRESSYSYPLVLVSVVLERFFDLVGVLFAFGLMLLWHTSLEPWVYSGAYIFAALAAVIFLFILVASFSPDRFRSGTELMLRLVPGPLQSKLSRIRAEFVAGAKVLNDIPSLIAVTLLTLAVWLVTFWQFQILLYFLGLEASFLFALSIGVIVALAVAAPSAPGFIGVIQVACVAAFALHGVGKEQALTYAITFHVYQYIFLVSYGTYVVARHGLNWRDIRRVEIEVAELSQSAT